MFLIYFHHFSIFNVVQKKKELNFSKDFQNAFDFSRAIFKIIDFPHRVDVDIARFQKIQKKKEKSKFTKKRRKREGKEKLRD